MEINNCTLEYNNGTEKMVPAGWIRQFVNGVEVFAGFINDVHIKNVVKCKLDPAEKSGENIAYVYCEV